jgi:D-glycero-D-manno-heptose 1,7-bisphosphate phosphatase
LIHARVKPPFPAVFMDRDGVLVRDTAPVSSLDKVEILPGVPQALRRLQDAGYRLVVITNQAIVARGKLSEAALLDLQAEIAHRIRADGGPALDGFYYCPHHPHADLPAYRIDCDCRKPRPGLILRAATELHLEPTASFMVGDRMTDIEAGHRAGCRTLWVQTGAHTEARIQTRDAAAPDLQADHVCADLPEAVDFILANPR